MEQLTFNLLLVYCGKTTFLCVLHSEHLCKCTYNIPILLELLLPFLQVFTVLTSNNINKPAVNRVLTTLCRLPQIRSITFTLRRKLFIYCNFTGI